MQRGKAVRILINLFVIAAATISMIPFVLMFFMATQDNQMIFAGDIFRLGKSLKSNFQTDFGCRLFPFPVKQPDCCFIQYIFNGVLWSYGRFWICKI